MDSDRPDSDEVFIEEAGSLPAGGLRVRFGSGRRPTTLKRANLKKLKEAIRSWEQREELRWVAFTATGGTFLAGADFSEFANLSGPQAFDFSIEGTSLFAKMKRSRLWLVACTEGACIGGGLDFLMACDYRIASAKAFFGHPGPRLGLITGWGGTASLSGLGSAGLQALLSGERLDAEAALKAGIVEEVKDDPLAAACRNAKRSVQMNLSLIKESLHHDGLHLSKQLRFERLAAGIYAGHYRDRIPNY